LVVALLLELRVSLYEAYFFRLGIAFLFAFTAGGGKSKLSGSW
jgi:hypothetical protein